VTTECVDGASVCEDFATVHDAFRDQVFSPGIERNMPTIDDERVAIMGDILAFTKYPVA
jgi:hypothetical protein